MKHPALHKELRCFLCLSLAVIALTALLRPQWTVFAALLCAAFTLLKYLTARQRYRRLQQLSLDLDHLLHNGVPMPICDYAEGELAVLGSQIQKMTLRLTETAEILKQDRQYLADAITDISHQLRTPLTAMHLTVALLSEAELPQARRLELTRELRELLRRTDWLVETLLKLSRLDAGTVVFAREPVSVAAVLERAAAPLTIPMELREQRLVLALRGRKLLRRPRVDGGGGQQSAQERRGAHAARRLHHRDGAGNGAVHAAHGGGYRRRLCAGGSATFIRALLQGEGRCGGQLRHRSRAGAQDHRRAAWQHPGHERRARRALRHQALQADHLSGCR